MNQWALPTIAVLLIGYGAVSARLRSMVMTQAMVFVALGLLVGNRVLGLVEVDTAVHHDTPRIAVDAVDLVQCRHVDDEPARVLGRVAVRAAETARDDATAQMRRLGLVVFCDSRDCLRDQFDIGCGEHLCGGRRGAPPAGQGAGLGGERLTRLLCSCRGHQDKGYPRDRTALQEQGYPPYGFVRISML